jgi:hypothetical protein
VAITRQTRFTANGAAERVYLVVSAHFLSRRAIPRGLKML